MRVIFEIFILFMFYSFIGWILEVVNKYIRNKKIINRGFLIGPICPIYGCGMILMIILLKRFDYSPILLFLMSIVLFSVLEYFTSYIMELMFRSRWWDYSKRKYNLNGRICVETMIPFALLGICSYYIVNPSIYDFINRIPFMVLFISSLLIFIVIFIDLLVSIRIIVKYKVTYNNINLDATEEINSKTKAILLGIDNKYK